MLPQEPQHMQSQQGAQAVMSPPPQQLSATSQPRKTGLAVEQATKDDDTNERQRAAVTSWLSRIKDARAKQKEVFQEMRDSMRFAAGYQWPGQKKRNDGRYVANWTLREANSKVASLYAKNPTAEYVRRKRLDFALYNEELESLVPVIQKAATLPQGILGLSFEERALLADYQHGMQVKQVVDRVGRTLEVLFEHQINDQEDAEGNFKLQFKQMVRRTIIAKVGYIRAAFARNDSAMVTSSGVGSTVTNRALQVKAILEKVNEGELQRTDKQIESLQNLVVGLGGTVKDSQGEVPNDERIVYDCLPSTSVIIDPKTKSLKGFVGTKWIAIEYTLSRDDAAALFEVPELKVSTSVGDATSARMESTQDARAAKVEKGDEQVFVYEVLNKADRTHFYVCEGYEKYLALPEYLEPNVRGFWPLYALTFNDIESDVQTMQTPFPPSDVELLMSAQREYNRSREELKKHRKANAPGWLTGKGLLSEDDKMNLQNMASNSVVELENIPQGMKPDQMFSPKPQVPIQPAVYDVGPQLQDAQLTTGNPQESLGVLSEATATGSTITEQNRMTVTASNIDDVDDALTWVARVSAEMMLQGFSVETVKRIAGDGAAWPQLPKDKMDFLEQITLSIKAASSGRPNRAVDLRNWQMVAPVLMQAGANPQFMVRHTLHITDSNIDPEEAFPLMPIGGPAQGQVPPSGGESQPSQQQSHVPGQTAPPMQSRPGPSGNQHLPGQPAANPASMQGR